MGITWNAVATPLPGTTRVFRGITWNSEAVTLSSHRVLRGLSALTAAGVLTAVAAAGVGARVSRGEGTAAGAVGINGSVPVGTGASPWFADAYTSPDGAPTLPDMAAVGQVVGAPASWAQGGDGHGIDVAVLDSGVTPVPGLDAPGKVVYGPDLSFDSQDATRAFLDGYGHGTAMAGIIAGDDGTAGGFKGIAPKARIVSVKVGSSNGAVDVSQVIAGIDWVVQHAHDPGYNIRVLNISLGTDSAQPYVLDPLAHAAEVAWRNGIVVVAAVGNDGTANHSIADPATDPYVVAVGSEDPKGTVNQKDDKASPFSALGSPQRHADVLAPGSYIVSLRVPGSTLDTAYPAARVGDRFFRGSGTSQATAVVSGAAADLLSSRPDLSNDQVKMLLMKTANDIPGTALLTGKGLIQNQDAINKDSNRHIQDYVNSTGTGSLEASRGSSHLRADGVTLSGEQDIFGNKWDSASVAAAEEAGATWIGGTYNGATWSGATWSSATWSGATWSGATWSGATWSGATWSGATWSGATWSSATWSGATWSGATWSAASYT